MTDLDADENDLLKAALGTAFTPAQVPEAGSSQEQKAKPTPPPASPPAPAPLPLSVSESVSTEMSASTDSWKDEYEEHVKTWRTQSAEARHKAEKERERWEKIREEEALAQKAQGTVTPSESGWESLEDKSILNDGAAVERQPTPSPADGRDMTTGESPKKEQPFPSQEKNDDHKWEDINSSVTSSYPSMSFPATGDHTPPEPEAPEHSQSTVPPPELSVTTSIFDPSLSRKIRASALLSSLAINMLLPFVNGVMLGFGEIFAKNVILDWMGWKVGGAATATNVGLSREGLKDRRRWIR